MGTKPRNNNPYNMVPFILKPKPSRIRYYLIHKDNSENTLKAIRRRNPLHRGMLENNWNWYLESRANHVVIAYDPKSRDPIVGAFKFDFGRRWHSINSHGTWVRSSFQRRGIAKTMWITAIRKLKVERVEVRVVSDRGLTLISSIKKKFPRVRFQLWEDGDRKLRHLKAA